MIEDGAMVAGSMIYLIVGIVLIVVAQLMTHQALARLTSDEKSCMVESSLSLRYVRFFPLLVVVVYLGAADWLRIRFGASLSMTLVAIVLGGYLVAALGLSLKQFKKRNLPLTFIRRYAAARITSFVGLSLILVGMRVG